MVEPGFGERLDQLHLVRGADRAGFDLEPFARAFLVDVHLFRQIAHGLVPRWRTGSGSGRIKPANSRAVQPDLLLREGR